MKGIAYSKLLLLALMLFIAPHAFSAEVDIVSISSNGEQGNSNSDSIFNSVNQDGRYVAFTSLATNLVPNDNPSYDVFVRDRLSSTTEIISVTFDGSLADGISGGDGLSISSDGRFVAFYSTASNLIPGDVNNKKDVFVRDRIEGVTEIVSIASNGTQGNQDSNRLSMSADGRYIAFSSNATNLVPEGASGLGDIYIHDRQTNTTERVSVAVDGGYGNSFSINPTISADGRFIAFASDASNLVPNDTNGFRDVFVYDRLNSTTTRVSTSNYENQSNANSANSPGIITISADGRYTAFTSLATNLVSEDTATGGIFVHDNETKTIEQVVSSGSMPSLSYTGRYLAYTAGSGLSRVLVYDRQTGMSAQVSRNINGINANAESLGSVISGDGQFVAFYSNATNLVQSDTNGFKDIFIGSNEIFEHNQPPSLSLIGDKAINTNQLLQFTIIASDPNVSDTLVYSATNIPDDSTFNPVTKMFSWTTGAEDVGLYEDIIFSVTDNGSPMKSDSESISITVSSAPASIVLFATKDSVLRPGKGNRNEGANDTLHQGNKRRAIVGFNLSNIDIASLTKASLVFTIDETNPAKKWGSSGRLVNVYRIYESWAEGNGQDFGLASTTSTRGEGFGVTWRCSIDAKIENNKTNCATEWEGGGINASSTDSFLHTNNMNGEIVFDVTADVTSGADSWILKKADEEKNGNVRYFSKENKASSNYVPKLILEY